MLQAFTHPNRHITMTFFVLCGGLGTAAALVGVADNPLGLLLALLACMAAVAAFVHPWRTADQFWHLIFYSTVSLLLFALLHIALEGLAQRSPETLSKYALGPLAATAFLIAILVCPAALLLGAIGTLVTFIHSRRHRTCVAP